MDDRGRSIGPQAVGGPGHQAARVQQMLGTIMPLGPAAPGLKFDSEKVTDFAKYTVLYLAHQFAARITDAEAGAKGHGTVYLQTSARKGDVLQIRNSTPDPSTLIFPTDVDEVRAEHPWFNSPV